MNTAIDIPTTATTSATPALCELRCEQCGYQLMGLSAGTCAQCGNMHLRCPECGHTQPADTQNVELIKPLHRWYASLRRVSILFHVLILIGFTLPWLAFYNDTPNYSKTSERWMLALTALFLIGPMRLVTMRLRAWMSIAVCCGLPLGAGLACLLWGSERLWQIRWNGFVHNSMWTLPAWLFAAVLTGWLCRGWFWLMYPGGTGTAVYRWFTGPIYRRREANERLKRDEIRAGENIRRYCIACGEQVASAGPELCEVCGTYHLTCNHCSAAIPISATGGTMESLAGRSMSMLLAMWSVAMAVAMLIMILILGTMIESDTRSFGYGYSYQGDFMRFGPLASVLAWGASGGALGGIALLRRRHVGWAVGWSLLVIATILSILAQDLSREYWGYRGYSVARLIIVLGLTYGALFLGHILAYPLVWLATRILLPATVARRVIRWISGYCTLDEAIR